jgi:hypothetical protein
VGASLEVMERDTQRMRGDRPWTFTNLKSGDGLSNIIAFRRQRHARKASLHHPGAARPDGATLPSLYHPRPPAPAAPALRIWHKVC